MDREYILEYLRNHKNDLLEKYGIVKIALYGSYAKNRQTESSDIDILVKSNKRTIEIDKLQKELSQALNKKVDILNEKTILLPTIKQMILKSAINV